MILNELTLRRFRIHEQLTLKFNGGVTGIVGRNGTGKSSIIEAIGFLFTGEGDDPKDKIITAGQSGTAYVRGTFTLNGKEGTIERALDTSRVSLEYDGQKLVKAGEVKELWANLLQIDSHVFRHVIMAKQKCIPELFAGEGTVREKAFQRIFMVPNTERLRSLIWESYIKTCPPPLPEDDLRTIDQELAKLRSALAPKQEKRAILCLSVLDERQMVAVIGYTDFYGRCLQDAEKRPRLESQLADAKSKLHDLYSTYARLAEQLKDHPPGFDAELDKLQQDKRQHEICSRVMANINRLEAELRMLGTSSSECQARLDDLTTRYNAANFVAWSKENQRSMLEKEIAGLAGLTGSSVCPTCLQPLQDTTVHLTKLQSELQELTTSMPNARAEASLLEMHMKAEERLREKSAKLETELAAARQQASNLHVEYDATKLESMLEAKRAINATLGSLQTYQEAIVRTEADIRVTEEQLRHLVTYTGSASAAEELQVMQDVLHCHRLRTQEILGVEKEISELQTEIQLLEKRRVVSLENQEKNRLRTAYNNRLRMAYDVLHTTQFPRKLVQTYGAVVEEELQQQLQRFDLPFQARVNEEFRVVVSKNGHEVPRLSGGQEMVVGLCLRLALHSMFSQAFPMLVIDEGTTHLDDENKRLYFQCIDELKKDKLIQQLIIIDHSSLLSDAVDHVIKL